MTPLLTTTMQDAYRYALANGGTLTRFPGGWQQPVRWMGADATGPAFGTSTIEGLVRRNHAVYTKWQEGRRGTFPVEVMMVINSEGM